MTATTALADMLQTVREGIGIEQKRDIQTLAKLMPALPDDCYPNGDDAAVLPAADGFNLLAMEGFIQAFVEQDPWFAGWCGVMVNISDIAAMGGRATALVNAIWDHGDARASNLMMGIRDACEAFRVPLVGGHTNLHAQHTLLSVAVLGHANALLSSFSARPGQILVAAIDLRGCYREPYLNWNAATEADPAQLRGDVELLPTIAERGLAYAAKDISQAGLLGTAVMLLESSRVGAEIDLDAIPKPDRVPWASWLRSFPSFGYLITTDKERLPALLAEFERRDIAAAAIGRIFSQPILNVRQGEEYELFWNLETMPLVGLNATDRDQRPPAIKQKPDLREVGGCQS